MQNRKNCDYAWQRVRQKRKRSNVLLCHTAVRIREVPQAEEVKNN